MNKVMNYAVSLSASALTLISCGGKNDKISPGQDNRLSVENNFYRLDTMYVNNKILTIEASDFNNPSYKDKMEFDVVDTAAKRHIRTAQENSSDFRAQVVLEEGTNRPLGIELRKNTENGRYFEQFKMFALHSEDQLTLSDLRGMDKVMGLKQDTAIKPYSYYLKNKK